jgi:tetratricopeptide (TPR) repeat protein
VIQYFHRINPRISCVYIRYYQRYEKKWDYALIYTRFIDKDILKNEAGEMHFPPGGTIETIKADNTPLCAIVQADPEHAAYQANMYLKANNFDSAIVWFQKALVKDPNDETSLTGYAIAMANKGGMAEAIGAIQKKLKITPNDVQSYDILAKLYNAAGDRNKAHEAQMKEQELIAAEQGDE